MTTHLVAYAGRKYTIPDIWIMGFCQGAKLRGEPSEIHDAIAAWAYQAALAELDPPQPEEQHDLA